MTDIEGFVTIYGHRDNLLNNNDKHTKASPEGGLELKDRKIRDQGLG